MRLRARLFVLLVLPMAVAMGGYGVVRLQLVRAWLPAGVADTP